MANNCLVTKLKGVVDNDNLSQIGEFKCKLLVSSNSGITRLDFIESSDSLVYITLLDDDVTFASATVPAQIIDSKHAILSNTYGQALSVSGASEGDWINVKVKSKYKFIHIARKFDGCLLSDLNYCEELTGFYPKNVCTCVGTFYDLAKITSLERLEINYAEHITGNISELGSLVNLTTLGVCENSALYTNFCGDFKDFVITQRNAGRTTCTGLNILDCYNVVTIGFGVRTNLRVGTEGESGTLKWDATKMSIQLDTSKKVMTIGYTQGEAEVAFPTYEVMLCD